jgi:hypothetical protein
VAAERVVSARELNRALLARQLLLDRARTSLPGALERIAGIQAQYAPAMYLGLWSRVADFHRADLTRALERRSVVQGTLLRATIHLVSAADYWPSPSPCGRPGGLVAPRAGAGSHGGRPGGADRAAPGPPGRRPGHAGRARRRGQPAAGARHRPVGGPRPGAAVRDLGAAQGRPLRPPRPGWPARHRAGGRPEHLVRRYLPASGPRPADVAAGPGCRSGRPRPCSTV